MGLHAIRPRHACETFVPTAVLPLVGGKWATDATMGVRQAALMTSGWSSVTRKISTGHASLLAGVCGPGWDALALHERAAHGWHLNCRFKLLASTGPVVLPALLVGARGSGKNRTCRTHWQIKPQHNTIIKINTTISIIQYSGMHIFCYNAGSAFMILCI